MRGVPTGTTRFESPTLPRAAPGSSPGRAGGCRRSRSAPCVPRAGWRPGTGLGLPLHLQERAQGRARLLRPLVLCPLSRPDPAPGLGGARAAPAAVPDLGSDAPAPGCEPRQDLGSGAPLGALGIPWAGGRGAALASPDLNAKSPTGSSLGKTRGLTQSGPLPARQRRVRAWGGTDIHGYRSPIDTDPPYRYRSPLLLPILFMDIDPLIDTDPPYR